MSAAYLLIEELGQEIKVIDAILSSLLHATGNIGAEQQAWLLQHCGLLAHNAIQSAQAAQDLAQSEYRATLAPDA